MAKKVGRVKKKAYEKGVAFEERVASWLKKQFGYEFILRDLARGKVSKRPYEIDVHGIKKNRLWGDTHLWVEAKAYKIKRIHVLKLVESAKDIAEGKIEKWHPHVLMLVSNEGFDIDAIGMADKYGIYCVKAGTTFEFEGKVNKQKFEKELKKVRT